MALTEAFDGVGLFLEAIRRRRGEAAVALDCVIGGLRGVDGSRADPCMWEDWATAAPPVRMGSQA